MVKGIMDGSSSLKAFLALAGESISERETERFEEGLNTKVKLTLYKKNLTLIWQANRI